jgi:hypothetical protein
LLGRRAGHASDPGPDNLSEIAGRLFEEENVKGVAMLGEVRGVGGCDCEPLVWHGTYALLTQIVLMACAVQGCSPSLDDGNSVTEDLSLFRHDAGEAIAGEELKHTFIFRNPLREPVSAEGKAAIRQDCGCASVELDRKRLEPGEEARVSVSLRTGGRSGPLEHGAVVVWRTDGGQKLPARFRLSAAVEPAIFVDPPQLRFDRREVSEGVAKEFRFTSELPIDWDTLRFCCPSDYAEVNVMPPDEQGGRCTLRFSIPPEVGSVSTTIRARARVGGDSKRLAGVEVMALAKATAEHPVQLAWKPRIVPVRMDRPGRRATAQFLMWGEHLHGGQNSVDSVQCSGYEVAFSVQPAAADGLLLDLELAPKDQPGPLEPGALEVQLNDAGRVRIPFFVTSLPDVSP